MTKETERVKKRRRHRRSRVQSRVVFSLFSQLEIWTLPRNPEKKGHCFVCSEQSQKIKPKKRPDSACFVGLCLFWVQKWILFYSRRPCYGCFPPSLTSPPSLACASGWETCPPHAAAVRRNKTANYYPARFASSMPRNTLSFSLREQWAR